VALANLNQPFPFVSFLFVPKLQTNFTNDQTFQQQQKQNNNNNNNNNNTTRVHMAFVGGIVFVTVLSWFRGTSITYFSDDDAGDARFDYFKQIVAVEGFDKTFAPFTKELNSVGVALITFLYVDFLDTSVRHDVYSVD
jgi:hypothetical protein